jgi:hypothetical protein
MEENLVKGRKRKYCAGKYLRRTQNGIIIPYHAIDKIVESLTLLIEEFFQNETIHFFSSFVSLP